MYDKEMSCSSPAPKDFIKIEKSDHHSDEDIISSSEQDTMNNNNYYDHQKEVSRAVGLFRKYLFPKAQHKIGSTKLGHTSRPLSLLEKRIFSGMKSDHVMLPPSSSGEKSSTAQLTIFYSGVVNVYDNVSIDQAKAIMLLASGSSKSPPIVTTTPKVDVAKSNHDQQPNLPSLCKLQAAGIFSNSDIFIPNRRSYLPLARRNSLRRFMDKRRGRITNKSPYATPSSSTS